MTDNIFQTYRKKPVEIQAVQWDGTDEGATPIINWLVESGGDAQFHSCVADPDCTEGCEFMSIECHRMQREWEVTELAVWNFQKLRAETLG